MYKQLWTCASPGEGAETLFSCEAMLDTFYVGYVFAGAYVFSLIDIVIMVGEKNIFMAQLKA